MSATEPLAIALKVIKILEKIGIPYFIGGSLASSVHGIPRATQDIDIIAKIEKADAEKLSKLLKKEFYIGETRLVSAIKSKRSFNAIHVKTAYKIDIFLLRNDAFSKTQMERRTLKRLGKLGAKVYFASAEDTIIAKLVWYEKGGRVSERQWKDVLGIINIQRTILDTNYLKETCSSLGLLELLNKAMGNSSS